MIKYRNSLKFNNREKNLEDQKGLFISHVVDMKQNCYPKYKTKNPQYINKKHTDDNRVRNI